MAKRNAIVSCGKELVELGLVRANSGNISVRAGLDSIFITPSGEPLNKLNSGDIIEIDSKGKSLSDNSKMPSMEASMHLGIYRGNSNCQAIVHAHPLYATIIGTIMEIKPLTYEAAVFCESIDYIPAVSPGSKDLADLVSNTTAQVIVLKNHGVVVWGEDLEECVFRLQVIEENAIQTYIAKSMGTAPFLEKH
ncbi:MAG: class II aldolase/adducin family protein [Firmicutes bacterium]|nr:class II aldolase/adducin family protein [Bacillota bacterium]MDD4264023.1 class II aldolase/adducin family protein [Bacillota bacterium]MDD4693001.1 class II aldolase/adducin family protein [Bacillota bacterium]